MRLVVIIKVRLVSIVRFFLVVFNCIDVRMRKGRKLDIIGLEFCWFSAVCEGGDRELRV